MSQVLSLAFEPVPEPRLRLRDNPLLVAQARRRLRRRQALPTFVVLAILGVCAMLFGAAAGRHAPDPTSAPVWIVVRGGLFVLLGLLLCARGCVQVGGRVSEDRESGLLEFHRATPTTPWTDAFGYLVGSAAREYAGAAILLPFLVAATILAGESVAAALAGVAMLLFAAWVYHSASMLLALTRRRRKGLSTAVGLLFLLFVMMPLLHMIARIAEVASAGPPGIAHLTPFPALSELGLLGERQEAVEALAFFGVPIGHVAYTLLVQGTALFALFQASARKLRRADAPPFRRSGALVLFGLSVLLAVGPWWGRLRDPGVQGSAVAYYVGASMLLVCWLATSVVPSQLATARSLRRARRTSRPASWLDEGTSPVLVTAALVVLAGGGLALLALAAGRDGAGARLAQPETVLVLAVTALVAAFAVGAAGYARLRLQQGARAGALLIAFLTLVLPAIVGVIFALGGAETFGGHVAAASPLLAAVAAVDAIAARWSGDGSRLFESSQVATALVSAGILAAAFLVAAGQARAEVRRGVESEPLGPRGSDPSGASGLDRPASLA